MPPKTRRYRSIIEKSGCRFEAVAVERQTELQRKALAKVLEESNLRNQSLSSEIALLQTEVETLESRFGEATEAGQKLDGARQELETSTRKYVAMEQALQQTEQERASNSTRTHQRRTTIPGVQC